VPVYIGLLRAVNLAGRNAVAMTALREVLVDAGMRDARTLLQSGNVVFQSDVRTASQLETRLQRAASTRFGFDVEFFVRSAVEWETVVAANPFTKEAKTDPGRLVVHFLKDVPEESDVAALRKAIKGRESLRANGRELYIVYPDGIGRSKLTNQLIEKTLGIRGTARNWNTVLKLAART
jgi:uncharacterized protein (DUF1697 family)